MREHQSQTFTYRQYTEERIKAIAFDRDADPRRVAEHMVAKVMERNERDKA